MRKKLKKRFTKKVRAAFKKDSLKHPDINRAYITGINSQPYMSKEQGRAFKKYLELQGQKVGKIRDVIRVCSIVYY